jgi:hypothetical protein
MWGQHDVPQWPGAVIRPGSKSRAEEQLRSPGNLGDPVVSAIEGTGLRKAGIEMFLAYDNGRRVVERSERAGAAAVIRG